MAIGNVESAFPLVSLNFFPKHRKKLKKLVLVGGSFDIIHAGHINHLKKAKSLGDVLVAHIASDNRVREKKGPGRPIFAARQRALVVSALKFVDYVFIYNGRHYDQEVVDKIKPDILLLHKEGYTDEVRNSIKKLKDFKGRVIVFRDNKAESTSRALNSLNGVNGNH